MTLSRRRSMESAIRADLAHPGRLSMAPSCECGCGRTVDSDFMTLRGAIFRGECFLLLDTSAGKCLVCGAECKDGNFCDPNCFRAWERRGMEEDEADFNLRRKKGD